MIIIAIFVFVIGCLAFGLLGGTRLLGKPGSDVERNKRLLAEIRAAKAAKDAADLAAEYNRQ